MTTTGAGKEWAAISRSWADGVERMVSRPERQDASSSSSSDGRIQDPKRIINFMSLPSAHCTHGDRRRAERHAGRSGNGPSSPAPPVAVADCLRETCERRNATLPSQCSRLLPALSFLSFPSLNPTTATQERRQQDHLREEEEE